MRAMIYSVAVTPVLLSLASAVAMAQVTSVLRRTAMLGDSVDIPCAVGGTVEAGWLTVRNNHSLTIPRGTRIKASYEWWGHLPEHVERVLRQDLLPGQSIKFTVISPMAEFGCTAQFDRGLPDLQVVSATLAAGQVSLSVKNASFGAAGASTARVRLMKCPQVQLGTVDVPVPPVGPGLTSVVLKPVALPPGCQYLDATADANNAVQELNEANNSFTGVGVCIR